MWPKSTNNTTRKWACGEGVKSTQHEGEYVAQQCKLHHMEVSVRPRSKNYTTRRWVCGQGVQTTPQEGEYVSVEYKLLHKKASIWFRSKSYTTRKMSMWLRGKNDTTRRWVSGHGKAVQATPQVGEFEDKEYKLLHDGGVPVLVLQKGPESFGPFSSTFFYTGCRLQKTSLHDHVFLYSIVILYDYDTFAILEQVCGSQIVAQKNLK
jgi:hypothetical protein